MKRQPTGNLIMLAALLVFSFSAYAQTTNFMYQGKLQDGALAANGSYQFEFTLYDAPSGGNKIGQTISDINATVADGVFAVDLNFGSDAFNGGPRYLDVSVRLSNTGSSYTPLNPREPISATPYAIKSLKADTALTAGSAENAVKLGGLSAAAYVQGTDPRMSDPREPLPNSSSYIQNGTTAQAATNFNISGEGKANVLSATAQLNIAGNRAFHLTGTANTFAGVESGNSVTTGNHNAAFGIYAGKSTTTGLNNSFFGAYAGHANVTGTANAFFGSNAGLSNRSSFNSFFGSGAGLSNFNGSNNSYFGNLAGLNNSNGNNNSFFGSNAGKSVANASSNSFLGSFSGEKTTTGNGNTFIGTFAGRENTIGFNNVYIGYQTAQAPTTGNSNVIIGFNSTIVSGVSNSIAIGPNIKVSSSNTTIIGGKDVYLGNVHASEVSGASLYASGEITSNGDITSYGEVSAKTVRGGAFEATAGEAPSKLIDLEISSRLRAYRLEFGTGNVGGNTPLCMRNAGLQPFYQVIPCSSSLRYKDNVQDYKRGLDLLNKLRPVTFNWKNDGSADVGFVAEEINSVEPLLNTYNTEGKLEGVRYPQITTVLVNAVKEQQIQLETQKELNETLAGQIRTQQAQINALKAIVCESSPKAGVCQTASTATGVDQK